MAALRPSTVWPGAQLEQLAHTIEVSLLRCDEPPELGVLLFE
jgi:hypothetical protein